MYNGVTHVNKGGVLFSEQSLQCGLCLNSLKQSLSLLNEGTDYHIFDCIRRRFEIRQQDGEPFSEINWDEQTNHTFHTRCLRNFYEAEQERDKTKKGKMSEEDIMRSMRCPICYPHSQNASLNDQKPKPPANQA